MNESVISALQAALSANPDDQSICLHLAELLNQAGRSQEAAKYFDQLLQNDPANLDALKGAYQSAIINNETDKAAGYKKLITALGGDNTDQANNKINPSSSPRQDNVAHLANNTNVDTDKHEEAQKMRVMEKPDNVAVGPWEDFEPPITLADVGGMEEVKKRLNLSFLAPLKNPELMKSFGKRLNGGLMLYGPPGCGKTFIARALAGELGAKFMSIGISDVLDMYIGESERKLHEIFEAARRNAPTVIFFDEVDALGQKRSQLRHSGTRNTVNQLLSELDSVDNDNNNVFVLAATNHPWDVDTALRRPGRFDRLILVLPPDTPARQQILEYHLRERPVENVDISEIAERTDFFSGADLSHLVESAVEFALEESIDTGRARPVNKTDFERALSEIKPSTRPWFETARNYAIFANEGGSYDQLLQFIQKYKI